MAEVKGLIAIGASTGGPRALQHILSQFPPSFPAALFVVQHMPHTFTRPFAERLNNLCALQVVEAVHGERVLGGKVYVSPGNRHLTVAQKGKDLRVALDDGNLVSGHKPSVDQLFLSFKSVRHLPVALVLLTGMGKDGANGMKQVKEANPAVVTLAQDQSSCIVFGMPKAAIEAGCVDEVLPLASMADKIVEIVDGWDTEGGENLE